jgi:hypothetical protein
LTGLRHNTNRYGRRYIYYHCVKRRLAARCREPALEAAKLEAQIATFLRALAIEPTDAFNRRGNAGKSVSNKWVGGFLRRRLRLATTKSRGVYVVPRTERAKVDALATRFGVAETPGVET